MPCTLGKVCNRHTVDDMVQTHKSKKGTKDTQAVAETNSNEFGRQGSVTAVESSDSIQLQPQTKGKKSVAGSCALQSGLRRNLDLVRVTSYSVLDRCVKNFWISFVSWQSLTKFWIIGSALHQRRVLATQHEDMLRQAFAELLASNSHVI